MKKYILLMRPYHYVKNLFVFAPLIFSLEFNKITHIENSLAAFILFSIAASSIYILNDIKDIEEDKNHPVKKNRPIVKGDIPIKNGLSLSLFLMTAAISLSALFNLTLMFIILVYLGINIFYSLGLKRVTILDIFIISTGFILRIFAGAVVIEVKVTMWIIIITFLLSLFLALAKRRDDVLLSGKGLDTRKNIDGYNLPFVNGGMLVMASIVIVSYILYTISEDVINKFNAEHLYLTVLFVILGIFRYMQITFVENRSGNPTMILWTDRFLQITILLWLISFLVIVVYNL